MSALPKRAFIAITGAHAELFEGGGHTTGVFISEALHPFKALRAAGFEVDLASETGKYTADWLSLQPDFLNGEDKEIYEDHNSEFRSKLDNLKPASDYLNTEYGLFYASAGHAALIDYPTAKNIQQIATNIYAKGGVVATVCHGPAIFPGVVDPKTNEPIIKGKTITGFTTQAEGEMGLADVLASWKKPLVDEHAKNLGAKYARDDNVWADYHIVDGRVVTGQNPQSATSTAEAAIEVFNKL